MAERVVDTSVLVAGLDPRDAQHSKALPLIEGLEVGKERFHLPTFVLVETYGVLRRRRKKGDETLPPLPETVVRSLKEGSIDQWLRGGRILLYPLTISRMEQAALITIRQGIYGPDAIIIQLAVELKLSLETYDPGMSKAWQREQARG